MVTAKSQRLRVNSVALKNDHIRIVQASILGSILVNILLILGSALLACSVFDVKTVYSTAGTQLLGCLLFVSVFTFLMPVCAAARFPEIHISDHSVDGIRLHLQRHQGLRVGYFSNEPHFCRHGAGHLHLVLCA